MHLNFTSGNYPEKRSQQVVMSFLSNISGRPVQFINFHVHFDQLLIDNNSLKVAGGVSFSELSFNYLVLKGLTNIFNAFSSSQNVYKQPITSHFKMHEFMFTFMFAMLVSADSSDGLILRERTGQTRVKPKVCNDLF